MLLWFLRIFFPILPTWLCFTFLLLQKYCPSSSFLPSSSMLRKKFKNSQGTESFYAFYVSLRSRCCPISFTFVRFLIIWVSCKSPNLPSKLNAVCASFCFLLVFINTLKQHHTYYKQVHSLACLLTLYIMVMYV